MLRCLFAFGALAMAPAAAGAELAPGEYLAERGWGRLVVKRAGERTDFALAVSAANGHECNLDGEVSGGRAELEAFEKDKPCIVGFTPGAPGAEEDSHNFPRPLRSKAIRASA